MSARASELRGPASPGRRALIAGAAACLVPALPGAQEAASPVIVVSRERVLRETRAGRALREAERELGAAFQARVDEVQRRLKAEEEELARLRGSLTREEFDRRAEAFDRRVRTARRRSQRQAAELQKAFREAREALTAALAPILVELLKREGASIVLDADQMLVAAPEVNRTEEVIALFDAEVEPPEVGLPEQEPLLPEEDGPAEEAPE
jgi:Skp family chaperone for outer membrane proteins